MLVYLTTMSCVGIVSSMPAKLLFDRRVSLSEQEFVELVLWQVPEPVQGSQHLFKYRMAFVVKGVCVLRYDNEAGKGDHKHINSKECPYAFTCPNQLVADFLEDVMRWRHDNRHTRCALA